MRYIRQSIWELWFGNEVGLSVWAARYCCSVKDDLFVREYITSAMGAKLYCQKYENKDDRLEHLKKYSPPLLYGSC